MIASVPDLCIFFTFIHVLVTCKFKKGQLMATERKMRRSRAANNTVSGSIWPKIELMQDIMDVHLTPNFEKDWINRETEKKWRHRFKTPTVSSMSWLNSFKPKCSRYIKVSKESDQNN